jgi:hypothetical protein
MPRRFRFLPYALGHVKLELPRSGLTIDGSQLRIQRPGLPVIALDARLLDDVQAEGDNGRVAVGVGVAATALTAGAAAIVGGLAGAVPALLGILTIARAARWLGGGGAGRLLMTLGRLRVGLEVADGQAGAARAAAALKPWTRTAPLSDPLAYRDVQRRLDAALAERPPPGSDEEDSMTISVGDQPVELDGDELRIGGKSVTVDVVRQLAQVGDNLPLGPHVALQAALALLVVAAEERRGLVEDPEALRARLAEYERWSGRTPGR